MDGGVENGRGDAPIGAVLEQARKERGLSLRDVEDATKIRTRYLDGLEREDFSVLPDAVYVQGFLKAYANFLGLDGEELVRELKARRWPRRERQINHEWPRHSEFFEKPLANPGGLAGAERRRVSGTAVLTVVLAILVLAAVIGFLYLIGSRAAGGPEAPENPPARADRSEQPETPEPADPPREQNEAPAREEPRESAPSSEEPAAETVSVTVKVLGSPSGLTISADGEVVSDVFAQPGFSQTFEAEDVVQVSTANAGAVEVEVNGRNLGRLGSYGQPLTRDFTPDS